MSTDHDKSEESDDAQLAWLLTSAHDAPEMRPEFKSALSQRLEREFAVRGHVSTNGAALPSKNGSAHDHVVELAKESSSDPSLNGSGNSKRRRWTVMAATAASLLVAAAVLSDP